MDDYSFKASFLQINTACSEGLATLMDLINQAHFAQVLLNHFKSNVSSLTDFVLLSLLALIIDILPRPTKNAHFLRARYLGSQRHFKGLEHHLSFDLSKRLLICNQQIAFSPPLPLLK